MAETVKRQTVKQQIDLYSMKMRIYPSAAQAEQIDKILDALRLAYNITFHEVFQKNPAVCGKPKEDGSVKPDFKKMSEAPWLNYLRKSNPKIVGVPSYALSGSGGVFRKDAKKAWPGISKTGDEDNKIPFSVDKVDRKDFHFYSAAHPRHSFAVQILPHNIIPSETNPKVVWLKLPNDIGKVKARGFNRKIWFGKDGKYTYEEAIINGHIKSDKKLTLHINKDTCGDYYASIVFSNKSEKKSKKESDTAKKSKDILIFREVPAQTNPAPIGIDVGIKEIAILNEGDKVENKHFKRRKDKTLRKLSRKLSRRWGSANPSFRDYRDAIKEENKTFPGVITKPLPTPSNRYLKTKQIKARLERKIARRRDTYYHQETAKIIQKAELIAIETLRVKNMKKNHKLAYALDDAAMSDFLSKLKYKAARQKIPILTVGTFEPTSQICSVCGFINPKVKNLSVREWTCPQCGTKHDRDVNAAKNILASALKNGGTEDEEIKSETSEKKKRKNKPKDNLIFNDKPDIVVRYSDKLTRYNDPRYIIINKKDNAIIDDAQGVGYRSISNARNCYKAKVKWAAQKAQ